MLESAPVIAQLNRASHPLAWVAAISHFAGKISKHFQADQCMSWDTSSEAATLLIDFLLLHKAGVIVDQMADADIRQVGDTRFGSSREANYGPWGPPNDRAPMEWAWCFAKHLQIQGRTTYHNRTGITLQADVERSILEPPLRIQRIADECLLLRTAGKKVGLLLNGPPGSGKSQALLHIAERLGGKSLRASLGKVHAGILVDLALLLRPDAVIFDDIDRTDTEPLLDAVDVISAAGIAVLASSNKASKICEAMTRSGRIDDHHFLGAIEPDILERFTDKTTAEEREALANHTVATVSRYLEIRDSIGLPRASEYLLNHGKNEEIEEDHPKSRAVKRKI